MRDSLRSRAKSFVVKAGLAGAGAATGGAAWILGAFGIKHMCLDFCGLFQKLLLSRIPHSLKSLNETAFADFHPDFSISMARLWDSLSRRIPRVQPLKEIGGMNGENIL